MAESEGLYTVFQTLASEEIINLISSAASTPKGQEKNQIILSFMRKHFCLLKRALPAQFFKNENIKSMIFFDSINESDSPGKIFGLCFGDLNEVNFALEQFKKLPNFEKYLVVIPRITTLCKEAIDNSGMKIHVYEFHLDVLPLENYFFIAPSPQCFVNCFVNDDITDVYNIANSLLKINLLTGNIKSVYSLGAMSCKVLGLLNQMKQQVGSSFGKKEPEFTKLIILDRSVDLVTALASQFFYGGMLDETYNVDYGYLKLPDDFTLDGSPDVREVLLSDKNDEFFADLRGQVSIDALTKANNVKTEILGLKDVLTKAAGTLQYSSYARRALFLRDNEKYLTMHYYLLDDMLNIRKPMKDIINFEYNLLLQVIDDTEFFHRLLNRKQYLQALRLLSFASVTSNGLSKALIIDFQKRLMNQFGIDVVSDLINLEKAGLVTQSLSLVENIKSIKKPKFSKLDSVLKLIYKKPPETPDLEKGYDNYVPILVRLVQTAINGEWEGQTEVAQLLNRLEIPLKIENSPNEPTNKSNSPQKVLVFVIGGVTSTEVQLFKSMGEIIFNGQYDIHVGSTNITHGIDMIRSLCPFINSKSEK